MAREPVRPRIAFGRTAKLRIQRIVRVEGFQKIGGCIGIVTGPREIADTKHIRFIFLIARIAGEEALPAHTEYLVDRAAADNRAEHSPEQRCTDCRGVALGRMARGHMSDFMTYDAGQLGFVIGKRYQPPRYIDISARQRKSVDNRAVEDGDAIRIFWLVRCPDNPRCDARNICTELLVIIGAALGRENFRVRFGSSVRLRFRRHDRRDLPRAGRRICCTGGQSKTEHGRHKSRDSALPGLPDKSAWPATLHIVRREWHVKSVLVSRELDLLGVSCSDFRSVAAAEPTAHAQLHPAQPVKRRSGLSLCLK